MRQIRWHTHFKKDYKRIIKRGYNVQKLEAVLVYLVNNEQLPAKYKDHALLGDYIGFRECPILLRIGCLYTLFKKMTLF